MNIVGGRAHDRVYSAGDIVSPFVSLVIGVEHQDIFYRESLGMGICCQWNGQHKQEDDFRPKMLSPGVNVVQGDSSLG